MFPQNTFRSRKRLEFLQVFGAFDGALDHFGLLVRITAHAKTGSPVLNMITGSRVYFEKIPIVLQLENKHFYRSIEKRTGDSYGALKNILLPQSAKVYEHLVGYGQKYAGSLPTQAADSLNLFVTDFESVFKEPVNSGTLDRCLPFLQIRLTALSAFRSELEFCLANLEDQIRATAERAILHLQRCIVADDRYRKPREYC